MLLNGRRLGILGASDATDINLIPINLIERVDVLKEGAGAIYGSDAIAGVVNFITRKDFDGAELGYEFGVSEKGDGDASTVNLAWGTQGERGSIAISGNYQKQDEISAGDRDYTREAIYFYTYVFAGGSSRTPTGRISLPRRQPLRLLDASRASTARRAARWPTTAASTTADRYNYQPFNLVMTPQERASLFVQANYEVKEDVEAYAEVLHNHTTSGFEIAPLPFDARSDTS